LVVTRRPLLQREETTVRHAADNSWVRPSWGAAAAGVVAAAVMQAAAARAAIAALRMNVFIFVSSWFTAKQTAKCARRSQVPVLNRCF
jgi:hypothetical protein